MASLKFCPQSLGEHILNIIQNHEILEQSDLQTLLKERGHNIPQATLSRKLKKLKIAKVAGVYKVIDINQYQLPLILNMQISDFGLIVLHTQPGQASSLAYFLDQKYVIYSLNNSKNIGIIGTIAGDDTVLLIIKSKAELNKVLQSIYETFPYLSPE
ncbi:arginine repressor [Wolbachia endosymbiont (group A) of Trypoxylon clavicerum]|uniref:arginine repressor n=1 Tax=Wolbachia endosymbiont (group A) of Trypoxylon clavicerum TaxID=2954064 RepID=UPI002230A45F|nr:ArgR family transcriptional regulator [Wolbachia endosymbiont (group A) of Trypoxylon clavicerum]